MDLWLIMPELYCFRINIQKIVLHVLYRSRANYIRLNKASIKILNNDNLSINEKFSALFKQGAAIA